MAVLSCNKTNMTRLVEALESGKYEQATGSLRKDDSYCCLGVACDLAKGEVGGEWRQDGSEPYSFVTASGSIQALLAPEVEDWLGVKSMYLELSPTARADAEGTRTDWHQPALHATELNDTGSTFQEIANAIRRVYLAPDNPVAA